jgi:hypothetical protein
MLARISFALALFALLPAAPFGRAAPDPANDFKKAQKEVETYLADLKGPTPRVKPITDDVVARALPGSVYFEVLFPQYPVGKLPPPPLKVGNVLAVKGKEVTAISGEKDLEKFCKANLAPVKGETAAKEATRAWLRLSEALHQDGFYEFTIPEESLSVASSKDGLQVEGKAVVEPKGGNKGEIKVALSFDAAGGLSNAEEKAKLVAGIRPKCQATKLLDPDPVVRAMAEQDILVLGRMGKPYLDEQRAKASPEVQKIIDRLWRQIVEEGR